MTLDISIFVKILFNFKKKNISFNKGKPENFFNIAKKQEFKLIISCHFKNLISPKLAWNSQSILIASRNLKRWHHCPYVAHISDFFLRFLRRPSKPRNGNLGLITSTVQVDLSKLDFNFDDIRTYFLQVLRE